jgi:predicted MFS family arabinose efflux permease
MGRLAAVGGASVLLFSLAAGVIVDRGSRRSIMIVADLGRAVLLLSVPILALTHSLRLAHLIVVAAAAGVLTVLFEVAYQSYLPSLVQPPDLLEGNRLLSLSGATAEVIGPLSTGVLVKLLTAPIAILLDALSYLVSAISVWAIRVKEPLRTRAAHESASAELLAGIRTVMGHFALRLLLFRSVMAFLFMGAIFAFYTLYAIKTLGLSTVSLGFAIACGGAGSILGGTLAGRIAKRVHWKYSFPASALIVSVTQAFFPLASAFPRWALLFVCVQQLVGDFAWTIYYVNENTLRQTLVEGRLLGRVNAAMQFASRGMLSIGALAAGYVAVEIGMVNTLWIGVGGIAVSTLWLLPLVSYNEGAEEGAGRGE